jgi:hypothetical protein
MGIKKWLLKQGFKHGAPGSATKSNLRAYYRVKNNNPKMEDSDVFLWIAQKKLSILTPKVYKNDEALLNSTLTEIAESPTVKDFLKKMAYAEQIHDLEGEYELQNLINEVIDEVYEKEIRAFTPL